MSMPISEFLAQPLGSRGTALQKGFVQLKENIKGGGVLVVTDIMSSVNIIKYISIFESQGVKKQQMEWILSNANC